MASRIAAVAAVAQACGRQGDRELGGRLRLAISGGAALSPDIARVFIGLGVPIYQGYGLTEASPVVSSNRPGSNLPSSIGPPLPGIEVKISEDGELLTRSRCVMRGYWKNEEATRAIIDDEGWLHTGDKASVDASGHFSIVGRVKDIIILSNGEKVPPTDIESAILLDPLFEQVMVVGEGKPFLAALVVLNEEHWRDFAASLAGRSRQPRCLARSQSGEGAAAPHRDAPQAFPWLCADPPAARRTLKPWTVDNGLLTPTLKLKRDQVLDRYRAEVEAMYAGLDRA
jgi:long-chain acyl-CoA synthetase